MKTDLKTPLKIKGSTYEDDRMMDAEGNHLADIAKNSVALVSMLEVVRRVNAHDALVEALEKFLPLATDSKCIQSFKWTQARDAALAALALAKEVKC